MKVLQISPHFSPNLGGVETHLDDLVGALSKKNVSVFMLSYRPLMTSVGWRVFENYGQIKILRIPWIPGLFYKLANNPMLAFLYLTPGLFIATPFILFFYRPDVVHAHGLIAGFVGIFWGKAFGKRVVISTHSMYHFPRSGAYSNFVRSTFSRSDKILTLSEQSRQEVIKLGIDADKVEKFTYWIDLKKFRPQDDQPLADKSMSKSSHYAKASRDRQRSKIKIEKQLGLKKNSFIIFFVGRLVEEKGVLEAVEAVKMWDKNIHLLIAGDGPLKTQISELRSQNLNIHYLGRVDQEYLPKYYSAADIVLVPSTHDEGFGRVILESLACGTPVVAARRGAIPEAMNEDVGRLIKITPKNIKRDIEDLYNNKNELKRLSNNSRKFAVERYSEKNVETIIKSYEL